MVAARIRRCLAVVTCLVIGPGLLGACSSDWDLLDPRVGPEPTGGGDVGGDGAGGFGGFGGFGGMGGTTTGGSGGVGGAPAVCGDGVLSAGEECDDANVVDDDGCSACVVDCVDVGALVAAKHPASAHCYLFDALATIDWDAARVECQALGGDLAVITTSEESAFIKQSFDPLALTRVWIGLHDTVVEGSFEWINGEPFSYAEWNVDEPNDSGGLEDCAEIRAPGWNDLDCARLQAYLCEVAPIVAAP